MSAIGNKRWRMISPHLDRALDMSTEERAAWLNSLQVQDATLAADLKMLLEEQKAIDEVRFLEQSPSVLTGQASLAGQTLGAYTLESALGQGGMGSVWLARRSDGRFEGKVAIKLLNAALIGREGEARFRREGSILGRITHPHIAHLLDAGVSPTGQPYLVLEHIEGEHIDRYCDEQGLDVEARIRLFLDVLVAVAHAHTNLIVHRDLKPSNVLVAKEGKVKLLDFGIAKLLEDDTTPSPATQLTREGGRALTPEYAAPEQVLGEPITTATDVYALGVLLYVLLGGQHPVGDNTKSPAELIKAIVDTQPPRLSDAVASTKTLAPETLTDNAAKRAATPAKLKRMLQGDLDNIVAKALKKDPQERYASVTAFADDLQRYLHHEPVSARPDSITYRTAKFVRRHRSAVAAGVLATVAIVAGLVGTITEGQRAAEHAQRAEQQARQAQHERDSALRELTYAEAADEFMRFLLSDSSSKPSTTSELLARAEQLVEKQFAGDPELRARLQLMIADLYGEVIDFKRAEAVLVRAQGSASAGKDMLLRAQIDCTLGGLYSAIGQVERAPALFDDALRRLRAAPDAQQSATASCLNERAIHNRDRGDAQAALTDAQVALRYLGAPRPGQRAKAAELRTSLADAYGMLGQYPQAIRSYELALEGLASMGREHTTSALSVANNLGVHLSRAGQVRRAAEVYERALDSASATENVTKQLLGANYAKVLLELGRTLDAKRLLEDGLTSATTSGNARAIAFTSLYAAPVWCAEGDLIRCKALLNIAREKLQAVVPTDHFVFGIVATTAAQLALAGHHPIEARDHLQRAVAIFDAAPEKSPMRIRALSLLTRTEQQLGNDSAARLYAEQAVTSARQVSKDFATTEWLGSALLAQAVVQKAQGNKAAAQATLGEALAQLQGAVGDGAPATQEARALLTGL